jgi:hypothetical protein
MKPEDLIEFEEDMGKTNFGLMSVLVEKVMVPVGASRVSNGSHSKGELGSLLILFP